MSVSVSRCVRAALFASTALLALPGAAFAESDRPDGSVEEAHSVSDLTGGVYRTQVAPTDMVPVETPQITINNNFSPVVSSTLPNIYDTTNVTGIGQVISDSGGGFIGTCTGTLINRRTIIFAAHCVNTRAATAYGANTGGVGIGIGFETNTRANAAGEVDELVRWLLGTGANQEGRFQSNTAQQFYNLNQVRYDPRSQAALSCTAPTSCFLEADIATGIIDRPTVNVPTWTMLFSPLTAPAAINPATGTGYHVEIAGYGAYGNGTTGAATSGNFRRRVAENMLGALVSLDQRGTFLFGSPAAGRSQLLYFLDFDDPARGTATANSRDFNGFRDNALPREGLTGPGDSGGPLIIDQAFGNGVKTVIGVLSGGSTFYTGQTGGSYGTQSFYQPLFLYWDWIVANNPYRYVTANAGNRNWEDGASWVTELDPAYQIINANGQLVNGLPAFLGGGKTLQDPRFGEMCFQASLNSPTPPASNECEDIRTGTARNNVPNTNSGTSGTGETSSPDVINLADASDTDSSEDVAINGRGDLDGSFDSAHANYSTTPVTAPTLANGLPGATGFVANNADGDRLTGTLGRYFDVTLRNAGNLSLSSNVTIDAFAIRGAQSQLTVNTGGTLNSLTEFNQFTGTVANNGIINSAGDYFLMSGLLQGSGRINAPFLTSILGTIAPGTIGTVGTLTVSGNTVMSSGSQFMVDLGANNASDRLAVIANATAGSGTANLGGTVAFSVASGQTVRAGDRYTILTATGGVTGTFATPTAISAILTPTLIYTANTVQAQLVAGSYVNAVGTGGGAVPIAYANLLDRNRGGNSNIASIYDYLDLQSATTIRSVLNSWAPRAEVLKSSIGTAAIDNMNRFFRSRIGGMNFSNGFGGTVAVIGNPLQTVSRLSSNQVRDGNLLMNYGGPADAPAKLPENMAAYFAGGYLNGESDSMATAVPFGQIDKFDGYYLAAGIETELSDRAGIGFAFSYTNMDGTTGGVASSAGGELYQGTIYGKAETAGGLAFDAQFSAALFTATTERNVAVGPTNYNLKSKDDTLALSGELGLSKQFKAGSLDIGPRAAVRVSRIGFTPTVETGGAPALAFDRGQFNSLQGVAGFTLGGGVKVRPYASAYYVHEFEDKPASFGANFVGGVGVPAIFALAGTDKDWFEASAGIAFGSDKFEIAVGADTTIGRDDVSNQSYRGSVTFRF